MPEQIIDFLNKIHIDQYTSKIVWSVLWLLVILLIHKFVVGILYKLVEEDKRYYQIKSQTKYFFTGLYAVLLIAIWANSGINTTTYIGLLSAGIAIALREPLTNIVAWVFIVIRKPFVVGNRISINQYKGDVLDIKVFRIVLMEVTSEEEGGQSTGKIMEVPCYFIFSYTLINYSKGFKYLWNETKVLITFESDWELAKEKLLAIAIKNSIHINEEVIKDVKRSSKNYMISYNKLTPIVYTDVKNSGIQLTMRYLVASRSKRIVNNNMWEDILRLTNEYESINLAYPTYRIVE